MELIRGLHNLRPGHAGCVATLGNFDGVHCGHQAVLRQTLRAAEQRGLPAVVMLFEPQPQEFFDPAGAPVRLMRLREKLQALARHGVPRALVVRFDARFAALTAEEFIERILIERLRVRQLVVGDDFRFGHARRGDFALLARAGARHGFEVAPMETFFVDGARVSSTRVREALARGELAAAERLLGEPYTLCGRVAHGDKRGRTLGAPTANLYLYRNKPPLNGVYVVDVTGLDEGRLRGVANVGVRPTVNGTRPLLEVHLFDFDRDIYGRYLRVRFRCKLREEQRFGSLDELKQRIVLDIQQARAWRGDAPATLEP